MKNSKHVKVMAIINTSPDSFAGDGLDAANEGAVKAHIQKALDQGADMLDIGGQSTRPGAEIISVEEEIKRVVPAVRIARQLTDKPISVDTFKPAVARAALEAGATIINDIHGAQDPEMVKLAQQSGCQIVIMHSRGDSKTMADLTDYPAGVVAEVCEFLAKRAGELIDTDVPADKIIVDPGIGFAKTADQSFELTRDLQKIADIGFPVLYGASQKSFIGKALGSADEAAPLADRAAGTAVVQGYAMMHGASIVRVHDVKAAVQARKIVYRLR